MSFEFDSQLNKSSLTTVMSSSPHQVSRKQRNSATRRSDQICHFFSKRGTCKKGDSCLYLHQSHENEAVNQERPIGATGNHQFAPSDPSIQQECRSYAQFGRCKFGSNCRYLHINPQDDFQGAVNNNVADQLLVRPPKKKDKGPRPCVAYERYGNCRYGSTCRYLHANPQGDQYDDKGQDVNNDVVPKSADKNVREPARANYGRPAPGNSNARPPRFRVGESRGGEGRGRQNQNRKLCRYFKAGHCSMGQRCKFWHPTELPDLVTNCEESKVPNVQDATLEQAPPPNREHLPKASIPQGTVKEPPKSQPSKPSTHPSRPVIHRNSEYIVEVLTDEAAKQLRATEVELMEKRYPKFETTDNGAFSFVFKPTDPDWPYDVNELPLEVSFSETYPKQIMCCGVPTEERIPETVRRCIARGIEAWLKDRFTKLEKRGRVEIVFRPFLRWLDKNLEDLFTEGLKTYQKQLMAEAAGIQFISAEELKEKYATVQDSSDSAQDSAEGSNASEEEEGEEAGISGEEDIEDEENGDRKVSASGVGATDPNKRGTEVKLHMLQLKESTATLMVTSISMVIQCTRCRNTTEVRTPPNRVNSVQCNRCHGNQLLTLRPALMHQFSAVLGYLDLQECTAFDMVLSECNFMVGCMGCSKEMAMEGLPPGQPKDTWCRHCHQKLRIAAEATRFLVLQPSASIDNSQVHTVEVKATRKVTKDPAIQLGQPLPQNGTCRHYKKSFRWLRFPCCGKAYPCDVCHDENEMDHDMKYANRMICGFCCNEQAFSSSRPCSGCESMMTKKGSAHWEGGKGCRDKIKMAKGDNRKYADLNKTLSRASQNKKDSGKKNTKLRHT